MRAIFRSDTQRCKREKGPDDVPLGAAPPDSNHPGAGCEQKKSTTMHHPIKKGPAPKCGAKELLMRL